MIGDDEVHATRFSIINGFVSGDASVTRQDQFEAAVDDFGQLRDVDAVRGDGPDGDVVCHVRAEHLQSLHQQGSGGLAVHVEVTPDTNLLATADSQKDALDGEPHASELEGRSQGLGIRV